MKKPTLLSLSFIMIINISYAQTDSLLRRKYFLKANSNLSIPFAYTDYSLGFSSVSLFHFTKRLNVHEFGFNSIRFTNTNNILTSDKNTSFSLDLSYRFSLVFLKKRKIKPYLGIDNDVLIHFQHTSSNNSVTEIDISNMGIQCRTLVVTGVLFTYKQKVLFDIGIAPFVANLFDIGYRSQHIGISQVSTSNGGFYIDNNQLNTNIFFNGIYLKLGVGIKI